MPRHREAHVTGDSSVLFEMPIASSFAASVAPEAPASSSFVDSAKTLPASTDYSESLIAVATALQAAVNFALRFASFRFAPAVFQKARRCACSWRRSQTLPQGPKGHWTEAAPKGRQRPPLRGDSVFPPASSGPVRSGNVAPRIWEARVTPLQFPPSRVRTWPTSG